MKGGRVEPILHVEGQLAALVLLPAFPAFPVNLLVLSSAQSVSLLPGLYSNAADSHRKNYW